LTHQPHPGTRHDNARLPPILLGIGLLSAALYGALAVAGELRGRLPGFFVIHVALVGLMLLAFRRVRRHGGATGLVLAGALLFRLVAALGQPALSDDVYRYVWDGRVQLAGLHPYAHAPADPALAGLRDENWSRINHPELKTIYPPLAQMLFLGLAASGAGPVGFKLAMGLLDFAVVLLLGRLLRRLELPADRLVLYAWNPLAVLETAGSGHVEPLGIAMVLLAAAWIIDRRPGLSTLALACGIQAKLLPVVLVPGWLGRLGWKAALPLALVSVVLLLPYAATGPALGAGTFAYAARWEHNAIAFPAVRYLLERVDTASLLKPALERLQQLLGEGALPWEFLYRHVWPGDVARLVVACMALLWLAHLSFRRRPPPGRECLLALAGVLLLAPTLHPWYVLWVLPFAAAYLSWGWLLFAMLVPLAYWTDGGDVPWALRVAEYLPPLVLAVWLTRRGRRAAPLEVPSAG
jgi:hypothetical protein